MDRSLPGAQLGLTEGDSVAGGVADDVTQTVRKKMGTLSRSGTHSILTQTNLLLQSITSL